MTLLQFIVPREKRVIIYSVVKNEIININQSQLYPNDFQADVLILNSKRLELIGETSEIENCYTFIYVHTNGELEIEINVERPKYNFHEKYND